MKTADISNGKHDKEIKCERKINKIIEGSI